MSTPATTAAPIVAPVSAQPTANKMVTMEVREQPTEGNKTQQTVWGPLRLRGGGAAKDCLMAFVCFECCEGCCDCIADIICCPCEMCC
ncbi:hypothetical protein DL93DRAFT_2091725 [Clavulina sp. PMI_390]|nr:hypothetical protein DL93DRAFT_2091725 [Clavulina sp. PMI_390]